MTQILAQPLSTLQQQKGRNQSPFLLRYIKITCQNAFKGFSYPLVMTIILYKQGPLV